MIFFYFFYPEFNTAVAEASTSDATFIVAELSKKLAHASRALMQKAKADADLRVASATERLVGLTSSGRLRLKFSF